MPRLLLLLVVVVVVELMLMRALLSTKADQWQDVRGSF
jgi:hypothetical protein